MRSKEIKVLERLENDPHTELLTCEREGVLL